jgi:WD40 repeat protein
MTFLRRRKRIILIGLTAFVAYLLTAALLTKLTDWRPRVTLPTKDRLVIVGFTPDGSSLVTITNRTGTLGDFAGPLRVWDTRSGQELNRFGSDWKELWPVALSLDGRYLAAANDENTLKIWATTTGSELAAITVRKGEVFFEFLEFSPDSRSLAALCSDGQVHLWTQPTWQECARFGCCNRVEPRIDGRVRPQLIPPWQECPRLVFCSTIVPRLEGRVRLLFSPTTVPSVSEQQAAADLRQRRFRFSPDSQTLALAVTDEYAETVQLVDLASRRVRAKLPAKFRIGSNRLQFSPDSQTVVVPGKSGLVCWHASAATERVTIAMSDDHSGANFAFCRSGQILSLVESAHPSSQWHEGALWDLSDKPAAKIGAYLADQVLLSPDGSLVATVVRNSKSSDYTVSLRSVESQRETVLLSVSDSDCHVEFSPDGGMLAVRVVRYPPPTGMVQSIKEWLNANFGWPAQNGDADLQSDLWDVTSDSRIATLQGCCPLAFSPDGKTLAAIAEDCTIKLWDLPPRKPLGLILAWSSVPAALVLLLTWWRGRRRVQINTSTI